MTRARPEPGAWSALTFDILGTVLDWEPEIAAFLGRWAARHGRAPDAAELLELYDRVRQPIQARRPALPYPEVLRRSFDAVAAALDLPADPDLRAAFGESASAHAPFPDSAPALARLKRAGLLIGALSNIDEAGFARATAPLGVRFDVVVTAERVGAYKPDPAHFRAALDDLAAVGVPPARVLHVAQSLRADIAPAGRLGLATVWVNRPGHRFGRAGAEAARPDFEVASLAELAEALAPEPRSA